MRLATLLLVLTVACGCAAHAPATSPVPAGIVDCRADAAIAWIRPPAGAQRQALDRWCATVGTPALRVAPAAPRRAPLVVVSWNVHGGAGDVAALVAELRAGRLAGLPAGAPLVLLLQEAWRVGGDVPATTDAGAPVPRPLPTPAGARDVLATAAALDLHAVYVPSMRNGRGREDRGNAVLSSLPLGDVRAIELPLEHQRRVAVDAAVRLAAGADTIAIRVVSAHLTTRTGRRRLWLAAAGARARQARALANALPREGAVVLGADLNTWLGAGEPVHRILRDAVGPSARRDRRPTFAGRYVLDDVVARLPPGVRLTMWRLDRRFGSDHHPLAGLLDVQ